MWGTHSQGTIQSTLNVFMGMQAISQPTRENEQEAWNAVCPAVEQLKEFFDFASVLGSLKCHSAAVTFIPSVDRIHIL